MLYEFLMLQVGVDSIEYCSKVKSYLTAQCLTLITKTCINSTVKTEATHAQLSSQQSTDGQPPL